MAGRVGRRWVLRGVAALVLGVVLAVFVAGAEATHGENVFAGQWTTNTGSVLFRVATAAVGMEALVAQGGRPCSGATVYYVGTYSDPGPRGPLTGVVSGCTVGGPTNLVGRYVGDANTDPGSAGDILIAFVAPGSFTGTSTNVLKPGQSFPYTGTFNAHLSDDGCCPATTTSPTTTTTTTTTTPPATAAVSNLDVDALFPVTGLPFSGQVATFQSSLGTGAFTATIDWGDGTAPSDGTVSAPAGSGASFRRSVSGTHTYTGSGTYPVKVLVSDPHGASTSAANRAVATACFCSTRPPTLGRTVDVAPISGQVFIRLPAGTTRAHTAAAKGRGFVALTVPREIPVGSEVDTRHGQIVVMAATAKAGTLAGGEFSGGIFQLIQNRRERGLSELRLRSASAATGCLTAGKARTAAAKPHLSSKVLALLHASVNGRFRTRGRYSAATVRGTEWTTTDRCDGTLTTVARGAVTVFDSRRRRNVVVTAGRSYLARARSRP